MTAISVASDRCAHGSSQSILRKLLSFPVAVSALLCPLALLTVRSRFDDPDMWWHLKVGQIVWTTHTIPTTDTFSYTTGHHAWIPHEWLSQATIFGAWHPGGYTGLMLWLCSFTAVLLIAGYALCSIYSANAKVGFLGALVIWFFATSGLAIRPQMVGYLLLTIELVLVHLGRTRDPRWFLFLPPLLAIWVNCHGSFFLGIVVATVFLLCSFFDFQVGSLVSVRWDRRSQQWMAMSLLLSVAALFLNPVGLRQVLYPLDTLLHQPLSLSHVDEWMPLQMNSTRGLGVLAILACILLLAIVRRSTLFFDEIVLLSLGIWLAANHRRMVFVFGILAAPILSRLLSPYWEGYDPARDRPLPNAVLIALSLLVATLAFPGRANLARQVAQGSPVQAVEFINAHRLPGNMLNDYVYGGYLIWAAPDHPVFVDGRGDVFEWTGVLDEFGRWATLESNPNLLLNKYNIDFCLLARTSPMAQVLPFLPGWKMVYSDGMSVIFTRTAVAGAGI